MMKSSYFSLVLALVALLTPIHAEDDMYLNVAKFGARGDGLTLDTEAIQAAIDHAITQGGGTVFFPQGNYLSSLLQIEGNHVTLLFEEGAILQATTDLTAYPDNARRLIHVKNAKDIHLRGAGLIELNGNHFTREKRLSWRIIYFENCQQVSVNDITILRSPNWTLTFKNCDGVAVKNVTIDEGTLINSDGIGILSSSNVHIANCFINTSDDAIVIKSRDPKRAAPTENLLIEDCVLASSSNAVKIGTESISDFRNITIRNIRVIKPTDGRRERALSAIALVTDDGGNIENIHIENVHAEEVYSGIFIRTQRRLRGSRKHPGEIRNVVIDGLTIERQYTTSSIMGIPDYEGRPAKVGPDITLRNINITSVEEVTGEALGIYPGERPTNYPDAIHFAPYPAYGLYIRHAEGIVIGPNVHFHTIKQDARPPIVVEPTAEAVFLNGLEE
jgi:polygalacturonase